MPTASPTGRRKNLLGALILRLSLPLLPGEVIRVAWKIRTWAGYQQLELRVTDGGAGDEPQRRDVGPDSVDGRGLAIVTALAETWGVDKDGLGQSVWARLRRALPVGAEAAR